LSDLIDMQDEFVNYSGGLGSMLYGETQPARIQPTQFGGWIEADGVAQQEEAAALASQRFQTDYNISQQGEGGNRCMQALTFRGDCSENQGQRGVLYSPVQERNFVLGDVGRYTEQNPSANVPPEQQLIFDFVQPKDETLRMLQRFLMTALKARQARNPEAFASEVSTLRDSRLPIFKTAIAQAQTMMAVPAEGPSDYTFNFHKGVADTMPSAFRGIPVGPSGVLMATEYPQAGGAPAAPTLPYVSAAEAAAMAGEAPVVDSMRAGLPPSARGFGLKVGAKTTTTGFNARVENSSNVLTLSSYVNPLNAPFKVGAIVTLPNGTQAAINRIAPNAVYLDRVYGGASTGPVLITYSNPVVMTSKAQAMAVAVGAVDNAAQASGMRVQKASTRTGTSSSSALRFSRDVVADSEQWDAAQSEDSGFVATNWRVPQSGHSLDSDMRASMRNTDMIDVSPAATPALSVFATASNQPIDVSAVFDLIARGRANEVRTPVLMQMTQYIEDITGARRRDAELAGPLARDQLQLVMDRLRLALDRRDAFFGMNARVRARTARPAAAPLTEMIDSMMQR